MVVTYMAKEFSSEFLEINTSGEHSKKELPLVTKWLSFSSVTLTSITWALLVLCDSFTLTLSLMLILQASFMNFQCDQSHVIKFLWIF